MNRIPIYRTLLFSACCISLAAAKDPIIISDGPGTATARPKIITTDGPPVPAYVYPPPIITTDGPAHLAYTYASPGKVVVTDGPEPIRRIKHASKRAMVKNKPPLPEPEASALAPSIPTQSQAAADTPWKTLAIVATSLMFVLAGALVWARRKRAF